MKNKSKKTNPQTLLIIILLLISLILFILAIRLTSPREIDDISPEISCEEKYFQKADILWIIPKYNNKLISENKEWCNYILNLNKTLGMHGITHEFDEFSINRKQEYIQEGINIFEDCFGFKPEIFKAPQLKISEENKKLIIKNNLKLKEKYNQFFHKVYHCRETGMFPNKIVDLI